VFADFGRSKFLGRHPNYFCNGAGMSGSIQFETLDSTSLRQQSSSFCRTSTDATFRSALANFIRIENPGCVTVRVEKNQRAR